MHTFWLISQEERFLKRPTNRCCRCCETSTTLWRDGTVHLRSIVTELAHRHLLNTEQEERNARKHFDLREVREGTGRGSRAMWWYDTDKWLQSNQGKWCVALLAELESAWFLWHFMGCLRDARPPPVPSPLRGTHRVDALLSLLFNSQN